MKRALFSYLSSMGRFEMIPAPDDRVALYLNGRKIRTFPSARSAAESVTTRSTGEPSWDIDDKDTPPANLERWKRESGVDEGRVFRVLRARNHTAAKELDPKEIN